MNRTLFIVLFHISAAAFATLAVHAFLAVSATTMPAWLLVGTLAALVAGAANIAASRVWGRWFS